MRFVEVFLLLYVDCCFFSSCCRCVVHFFFVLSRFSITKRSKQKGTIKFADSHSIRFGFICSLNLHSKMILYHLDFIVCLAAFGDRCRFFGRQNSRQINLLLCRCVCAYVYVCLHHDSLLCIAYIIYTCD